MLGRRGSYAFLALPTAEVARSAGGSDTEDFPGKLICIRRSFFGSRQLTCGSMREASTLSRYFMAMFMSESSSESERWCGCNPRSMSFERSEEHTSELQSQSNLVCRLLLEK